MARFAAAVVLLAVVASATQAPKEACQAMAAEDDAALVLLQHEKAAAIKPSKVQQDSVENLTQNATASLQVVTDVKATQPANNTTADSAEPAIFDPSMISAAIAEYVAMTLFVTIGCGCAMGIAKEPGSAWILQVSLTFGFAITSLAYAVGAYSGGQINCAVTLGLVLVGKVSIGQGILNFIAQMLGSLTGAYILTAIFPKDQDKTGGLGSNGIAEGYSASNVFVGEAMMTFLLMFVVLETAVNPNSEANRALACVAIGFAVFLAHTVLIPIDGCSINPTRSFGPAFVAKQRYDKADTMKDMSVFFAAPCAGAALAAGAYSILRSV